MDDYKSFEFQERLSQLLRERKVEKAIDEVKRAIQESEERKDEEEACYLYSQLAGIYFAEEDTKNALAVLEECELKYSYSLLAKYLYVENLFWHLRDYKKVIQKAKSAIVFAEKQLTYYDKCLYLRGLAHTEMEQFDQAVEMLKQTHYYDLALVEKLIDRNVGQEECRKFLLRALDKYEALQRRGEEVNTAIQQVKSLIKKLDNAE